MLATLDSWLPFWFLAMGGPWLLAAGALALVALGFGAGLGVGAWRARRLPAAAQQPAAARAEAHGEAHAATAPAGLQAPANPPPEHKPATSAPAAGPMTVAQFDAALEEAAWQADRNAGAPLAVLHLGIDELREINDAFGMPAGDAVIQHLGQQLAALPSTAHHAVAALSGGSFALMLAGDEVHAITMATHLIEVLSRPFETSGPGASGPLALTVSVGIACYPAHGAWSRLVRHAAAAMHHVQAAGGNGHAMYAPSMAVDLREQAWLLHDLRLAVPRGELRLLYQPKIDAASLQITAAEALLRWEHPVRGVVSPAAFIELAERHGLIDDIGAWVAGEACRQAAAWRECGLHMRIAINVSGRQLRHDRFVAELLERAAEHHVPPSRLTVEITETVAMEDTAATRAAFERLRSAGFHVSIDDFGTGHSSLAVLRRLPAAELKVDRQFVVDLETSASARSIVEAVLAVARTLHMRVVAEGVETVGQRDILVQMGCDEMQGYLFARPMSAAALALWAEGDGPAGADTKGLAGAAFRPSLFRQAAAVPASA